jgi:hypothetical protein
LKRVEDVEICFCLNTQVSMVLRSCKCCWRDMRNRVASHNEGNSTNQVNVAKFYFHIKIIT